MHDGDESSPFCQKEKNLNVDESESQGSTYDDSGVRDSEEQDSENGELKYASSLESDSQNKEEDVNSDGNLADFVVRDETRGVERKIRISGSRGRSSRFPFIDAEAEEVSPNDSDADQSSPHTRSNASVSYSDDYFEDEDASNMAETAELQVPKPTHLICLAKHYSPANVQKNIS